MAELDYRPLYAEAERSGGKLAMVTLTMPSDWERWAQSPEAVMRYLRMFQKRWDRSIGPPWAVWKLEFQRRGAPHGHLFMACPRVVGNEPFKTWLSRSWYEVVGSGDPQHLKAGTGVDWSPSRTVNAPNCVAAYFVGYAGPGQAKGYQHEVPELWQEADRFRWWGYWRLKRSVTSTVIDEERAVQMRRMMRHNYRTHHPNNRRLLSGSRQGRMLGGYLLVPDGVGFARQLARALDVCGPLLAQKSERAVGGLV